MTAEARAFELNPLIVALVLGIFLLGVFGTTCAEVLGDLRYTRDNADPEKLESYPPSIFQHWVHRMRYRCDACHNHLFEMTPAETVMTHDSMGDDKFCNSCHNGKAAFDAGFNNCNRCHISEEE